MKLLKPSIIAVSSLLIVACGGGGGGGDSTDNSSSNLDIVDSATLSRAASFDNGTRVEGSAPVPASASAPPMEGPAEIPMTTNSVTNLLFEVPLPDSDSKIGAVFVEIEGSGEHFVIVPDETSARNSGSDFVSHSDLSDRTALRTANRVQCVARLPPCEGIQLTAQPLNSSGFSAPVNTRANVSTAIIANVAPPTPPSYDWSQIPSNNWTQPIQVDVSATPTGSGNLQFTLTWDTTADLDLHIFEPGGFEIAYFSPVSSNGFLDVDDLDGFGPENVFYQDGHDAGNYVVEVHHFSGALPTNYTVTITDNGSTTSYSGTLGSSGEEDIVTTISSSGSTSSGGGSGGAGDSGGSGGSGGAGDSGGSNGSGTGNFCYDNYPSDPCDLLQTQGGATSSTFTTSNTCSGLGYSGPTETFNFGSDFGTFGQSTPIGIVGTCVVDF